MSELTQMMTTYEKRIKRIAQLKARLQKEEAKLNASKRKERTGQLVSWGVLVEELFKEADAAGRQRIIESAQRHLKERNLERALAGFSRLSAEEPKQTPQEQSSLKRPQTEITTSFVKPDLPDESL